MFLFHFQVEDLKSQGVDIIIGLGHSGYDRGNIFRLN